MNLKFRWMFALATVAIAGGVLLSSWERLACAALRRELLGSWTGRIGAADLIAHSRNVAWLEAIAASREGALRHACCSRSGRSPKILRRAAYMRLGELASRKSLAAVRRIEEGERAVRPDPGQVSLTEPAHPASHFSDQERPSLAYVEAPDGTRYRIWQGAELGAMGDLLVAWTTATASGQPWVRPRLVPHQPLPWIETLSASWVDAHHLRLADLRFLNEQRGLERSPLGAALRDLPRTLTVDLDELRRDSDADGWTDAEEQRLGLAPDEPDTDGDGIPDGEDVCPDLASSSEPLDEEARILQRVFLAAMGFSGSRKPLIFEPEARRVPVFGYEGPVLFGRDPAAWRESFGFGVVSLSWRVEKRTDRKAEVYVQDYEGNLAAAGYRYFLHKVDGEWLVTRAQLEWIS